MIIIIELIGLFASIFTQSSVSVWYATLQKPAFIPPNYVFAPVWVVLFALMSTAAFMVWKKGTERQDVRVALNSFGMQFLLNVLWSLIFFGMRSPLFGLIEVILLWIAIAITMMEFRKVSERAFWLMVPYILWVTFTVVLTYYIWILN